MTLDHRNASEMRLGHILLITNIIEVPWARILFDKSAFSRIWPNDAEHPTNQTFLDLRFRFQKNLVPYGNFIFSSV